MRIPPTPPSGTTVFLLWWSPSSTWDGRFRSRSFPAESPAWKVAFRYLARSPAHEVRLFYVSPKRPCEPVEARQAVTGGLDPLFAEQLDRLAAAGLISTQKRVEERIALAASEAAARARQRLQGLIARTAEIGEALLREETTTTTR